MTGQFYTTEGYERISRRVLYTVHARDAATAQRKLDDGETVEEEILGTEEVLSRDGFTALRPVTEPNEIAQLRDWCENMEIPLDNGD